MLKKTIKIFRNSFLFLMILSVSFSNVPFYMLSGAVDGYVKTANIVDQAWHLSKKGNVVDSFVPSYRNKKIALLDKLAGNLKVQEAHAAVSYVGGVTCSRAGSTGAALTCSLTALTGGLAASPSQDDIVIAVVSTGSTADRAIGVTNVGYTELPELYSNATNDTNLSVSWKIMGATPDTAVNFSPSGSTADAISAVVHVWRGIDTGTPFDVANQSITGTATGRPNPPPITPVTSGATVIVIGAGSAGAGAVYTAAGLANFRTVTSADTYDSMTGMGSFAWTSGAYDSAQFAGGTTGASDSWASYTLALRPLLNVAPTLTVSQPDGTGDTVTVGDLYNITYDLADPEQAVTVAMYYDVDAAGLNGTAITGACATGAEGTGVTCSWDTTGMTAGTYYVYGLTSDGIAAQVSDYSPGVITINAPATLTIGVTAGSKATNLNSGDTSQYANTTTCNSTATCSAFTILSSSGETLNSIKITETGTTNASNNLSNLALFYDTDGNYSNGVTGQYGSTVATYTTETATVSGTLALVAGTTYYFYVRTDLINGANDPVGGETINFQIAANADVTTSLASTKSGAPVSLAGTTTVKPNATAVTYQVNSDGGRSGYSATVTGNGFGVAPVGSRGSCSGAVNTGCVQFIVGGTATVATGDVSAWANRSLSFTVNSAIASNGGASAIEVSSGAQTDATPLTFYIYPTLTSVTDCDKAGFPVGAFGREYDATDAACPNTLTDGAIIITGDHFGAAGSVTILGSTATQSAVAAFCGGSAYTSTCSALQVPTALAGNTGSIVLTRTSDSKTDTLAGFRVLPRITGFTPASASEGGAVTVGGNHFCQGAGCPGSFSAGVNDVVFTSAKSAVTFTSWSATAMSTDVPTGAVTGDVILTSNSYASNAKSFTVLSNTPAPPTSLLQWKNVGLTQSIVTGGAASSTPIYLSMTMEVPEISGGMLYPQVEYKAIGTAFACGAGACGTASEGTGSNGPGPATGSVSVSPTDEVYHWQARVRHNKSSVDYYSAWVSFGGNGENETDFKIDTTAPSITSVSSGTPGSNSATITWETLGEISTTRVEYDTAGTFTGGYDCAGTSECTALTDTSPMINSPHTVALSNLSSGTTYHYRVRSKDSAGNEKIDPPSGDYTFQTQSISAPAKTTRFHISGSTGAITSGAPLSQSFSVVMPENATTTKSIFVEIKGVYVSGASSKDVAVQVNAETAKTYILPTSSTSYFKIIHSVSAIDVDPGTNTLTITPQANTTMYILSADIYVNYVYTP